VSVLRPIYTKKAFLIGSGWVESVGKDMVTIILKERK